MRVNSKGQVTIPTKIREQAGLAPHTEVDIEFDGSAVRISRTATPIELNRGALVVAHLLGRGDAGLSTDEVLTMTRGE